MRPGKVIAAGVAEPDGDAWSELADGGAHSSLNREGRGVRGPSSYPGSSLSQ